MSTTPSTATYVTAHTAHAYPKRAGAMTNGKDHIRLDVPLHAGRFHREAGQILCTTQPKWGLTNEGERPTCPKCVDLAKRHNVIVLADKMCACGEAITRHPDGWKHRRGEPTACYPPDHPLHGRPTSIAEPSREAWERLTAALDRLTEAQAARNAETVEADDA